MPREGLRVFEYSAKENSDLESGNPGWGDYLGEIEELGLDLGVRCLDTNAKVKLDRDTFREAPRIGDIIRGVYEGPPLVLAGYEEGNKVILETLKDQKKKKTAPSGDEAWENTCKKVFKVWHASSAIERIPLSGQRVTHCPRF